MRQLEILVGELFAVDRFSAGAVVTREIAALEHEVGYDAMENGSLVAEAFFARAQGAEVLDRFRDDVVAQLHHDATERLAVGRHVEETFHGAHDRTCTALSPAEKRE